jgi:hypothetical protein
MKVISLFSFLSLSLLAAAPHAAANAVVAMAGGDDAPSPPPKVHNPIGEIVEQASDAAS